jgi:hypothetical protein
MGRVASATMARSRGTADRARQGRRAGCAQGRQGARRRQPRAALQSLNFGWRPRRGVGSTLAQRGIMSVDGVALFGG